MYCIECGAQIPENSKFCSHCGQKQIEGEPSAKEKIAEIIQLIPEDWLQHESDELSPSEMRTAYTEYLHAKLSMINSLVKEAEDAR